jgi:toxin ParE1/3/4
MSGHFWLSPMAVADVEEIGYYVARDDRGAAQRLVERFSAAFALLADHPHVGRRREEFRQVRSFVVRRYVVLYREVRDGIEIIRVMHGARDIATALKDLGSETGIQDSEPPK